MSDLMDISRRLVAVFAADVEGYSRLMGADEVATLKGLTERRAILDRFIGEHKGRIANTAGDSVLAEFGSAVDAVQCAVEAQAALAEANSGLAPERSISFRIGIHIGDVVEDLVIRDRRHLSEDGFVLPIIAMNKNSGRAEGLPEIVSRGFMSMEEGTDLLRDARQLVLKTIEGSTAEERGDWGVMQEKIRADLKRFISKQTSRRPLIMPVILEV